MSDNSEKKKKIEAKKRLYGARRLVRTVRNVAVGLTASTFTVLGTVSCEGFEDSHQNGFDGGSGNNSSLNVSDIPSDNLLETQSQDSLTIVYGIYNKEKEVYTVYSAYVPNAVEHITGVAKTYMQGHNVNIDSKGRIFAPQLAKEDYAVQEMRATFDQGTAKIDTIRYSEKMKASGLVIERPDPAAFNTIVEITPKEFCRRVGIFPERFNLSKFLEEHNGVLPTSTHIDSMLTSGLAFIEDNEGVSLLSYAKTDEQVDILSALGSKIRDDSQILEETLPRVKKMWAKEKRQHSANKSNSAHKSPVTNEGM